MTAQSEARVDRAATGTALGIPSLPMRKCLILGIFETESDAGGKRGVKNNLDPEDYMANNRTPCNEYITGTLADLSDEQTTSLVSPHRNRQVAVRQ